jgi:hypothetical protein
MTRLLFAVTGVFLGLGGIGDVSVFGQAATNYDESRVGSYTLPDPLRLRNGKTVKSARQWERKARPAVLALFAEHVYGRMPGKPKDLHFSVVSEDPNALGGKAVRKQITVFFARGDSAPSMDILLYLPKGATSPVPVFTGLNYCGNHCVSSEPGITLSTRWMRNSDDYRTANHQASEASRGTHSRRWPVEELVSRGYGLATVYYGDLEPDHEEGWKTGIRTSLQPELNIEPREWSAIGAWGWGLSRIMDYLETDPAVDAHRVVITGHSRLGKAALWAAANDTRFAVIVSNDSGEGGTALARRNYGETVKVINTAFPHWFSPRYKEYNDRVDQLPVDQHMLLALMAPRPLYVASAEDDQWADPKGEFLAAKHAEPVYALFGKPGLGIDQMPPVNQPVGNTIGYHMRTGKHDITAYDWEQYLTFANRHLGYPARESRSQPR